MLHARFVRPLGAIQVLGVVNLSIILVKLIGVATRFGKDHAISFIFVTLGVLDDYGAVVAYHTNAKLLVAYGCGVVDCNRAEIPNLI